MHVLMQQLMSTECRWHNMDEALQTQLGRGEQEAKRGSERR